MHGRYPTLFLLLAHSLAVPSLTLLFPHVLSLSRFHPILKGKEESYESTQLSLQFFRCCLAPIRSLGYVTKSYDIL